MNNRGEGIFDHTQCSIENLISGYMILPYRSAWVIHQNIEGSRQQQKGEKNSSDMSESFHWDSE